MTLFTSMNCLYDLEHINFKWTKEQGVLFREEYLMMWDESGAEAFGNKYIFTCDIIQNQARSPGV